VLFLGTGLNYYETGHPPLVGETSLPWSDNWSDLATQVGLVLIWIAAVLTAITGWDYFAKARPFLRDDHGACRSVFRLAARTHRPAARAGRDTGPYRP